MKKRILVAATQLLAHAGRVLEHHPKHISVGLAAVLLGGGGGAFAVASLGPDPAALPVREVLEAVDPLPLAPQAEALQGFRFSVHSTDAVRSSDTAEALLARLGINDPAAAAFLRQNPAARAHVLGAPGRAVRAEATESRNLMRLSVRFAPPSEERLFKRVVIERQADGRFTSYMETAPLAPTLRIGGGIIRSSLYAAADDAGIPDEVTLQIAEVFSGTIDFHRGLRVGDRFQVVYELLEGDGELLRVGRVVSTEFVNTGRRHQAMWFQEPGRRGGYYNFAGESLERAFLASPMQVSRVTSGFAMRFHPIHHVWKRHMGVDYGAPTGAPVRTVGDGRVDFAGRMGGYGNVVQIDHGNGDSTLYAHLSRIDVRPGQRVERGQRIGAVGATGWATGPHLHFEFREKGVHRDPIEVARQSPGEVLSAQARPAFELAAQALRSQLAAAGASTLIATAQ